MLTVSDNRRPQYVEIAKLQFPMFLFRNMFTSFIRKLLHPMMDDSTKKEKYQEKPNLEGKNSVKKSGLVSS